MGKPQKVILNTFGKDLRTAVNRLITRRYRINQLTIIVITRS